ncbi:hypothetical protein L593_01760 [Salinarchaeum sp. Harcht-Bsk1]|uniref:hypothetical protein n=1 Tax=Salinarchaeum sp. Harcht-Bsk1 TaxID=1333523 RepID=UPI0003423A4D|nr:hypothetical protein [Salinarchaeum sp. Harcht-Bsk1]AGN00303.1 hypothetical protein L593_01760 [Salinarchaeum sp. Harcht-Bsk1]
MSTDIPRLDRRTVIKGVGGAGAAGVVGGLGLFALSGTVAAADTSLEASNPSAVTTDDGEIQYVAFGGRLRFEWDGLDEEATYGWYRVESRVNTGGGWSNWRSHGSDYGELGANWGGSNDYTQDTGTDGIFQFKYGAPYGQQSYAIAGSGSNLLDSANKYDVSVFEADSDGGTQETDVHIRMTCRVYDGEPGSGGSVLIEQADGATFTVTVNNRTAMATTGGEITPTVGADES